MSGNTDPASFSFRVPTKPAVPAVTANISVPVDDPAASVADADDNVALPDELAIFIINRERWREFVRLQKMYREAADDARIRGREVCDDRICHVIMLDCQIALQLTPLKKALNSMLSVVDWTEPDDVLQFYEELVGMFIGQQTELAQHVQGLDRRVIMVVLVDRLLVSYQG